MIQARADIIQLAIRELRLRRDDVHHFQFQSKPWIVLDRFGSFDMRTMIVDVRDTRTDRKHVAAIAYESIDEAIYPILYVAGELEEALEELTRDPSKPKPVDVCDLCGQDLPA